MQSFYVVVVTWMIVWIHETSDGFLLPTTHPKSKSQLNLNKGDRRSFLVDTSGAIVALTLDTRQAIADDDTGAITSFVVPKSKSVVVLGANGGTGSECISAIVKAGRKCIATSRSGEINYPIQDKEKASISIGVADVTSVESLELLFKNSSNDIGAVIFAASASTKGGNASEVDRQGVINAAKVCIDYKIPRLVIVSSGTVTRPDSAVYKLLNFVGKGIMEAKIQGEDTVRVMYANPDLKSKGIGYTIIRPGGLTSGESLGASSLELNQGDNKSGRLSRADVAELCIHCLDNASAFDTTFECYEANTAKPVESVGLSNIMKSTDPTMFTSGKERRGDSWDALFDGLSQD